MSLAKKVIFVSWGELCVGEKTFKDCRVKGGFVEAWKWAESGTRHNPGIQIQDFISLLANGNNFVSHLVLSAGVENKLQLSEEARVFLYKMEINFHYLQTEEAIKKFNELIEENYENLNSVAGLFHSTC